MKTTVSALIALSVVAGIMAPTSAAMAFGHRDQWVPEFKSSKPTKAVKNRYNDDDDDEVAVRHDSQVNKANKANKADQDDQDDPNELPEWADDAM